MLPQLKEDYPNLKLSQYKERVFESWEKSSENPKNRVGPDGTLASFSSPATAAAVSTAAGIARAASRGTSSPMPTKAISGNNSFI